MTSSSFSLCWDAFQNNLCDGFAYLQQKSEFVDMTLAADGHFVQVHKSIVALASPFLRSLLKSLTCPHPVIYLDVSHEVLSSLLEYMYFGEIVLPQEKCKEFIKYGRKLKMFGLEKLVTYYDEPLVIEKLPDTENDPAYNPEVAVEIQNEKLPQEANTTIHNPIIQPSLESQILATEPIIAPVTQKVPNIKIIPANQDIATIPNKDIPVSNKLIQLLESVENYEFTENVTESIATEPITVPVTQNVPNIQYIPANQDIATVPKKDNQVRNKLIQLLESVEFSENDTDSNMKMAVDTNIPLSEFNLSPNICQSVNPNVQITSFASSITDVGTHHDMPIITNNYSVAQASDTFKADTTLSNDFKNLDFFKSSNDMSRLNTVNIESTSKEAHIIDENNETMNSIDTVLEYKLLGDFSIADAKNQVPADKGIKDDPWDLIPVKNGVDLNSSDDESNMEKEDKVIDVEEELDKIERKKDKIDISSLPNLDNETLFDESFRKDSDVEMSDEEREKIIAPPIEHSSPIPATKETDEKLPEKDVSLFGQVVKKIKRKPQKVKVAPVIQFTLSNRDSLQMIINRYMYYVHYKSGARCRRWRCVDYKLKHCLAYVDTDGDNFVKRSNSHNHGFHNSRITKQIAKGQVFTTMEDALTFCQRRYRRTTARQKATLNEDDSP